MAETKATSGKVEVKLLDKDAKAFHTVYTELSNIGIEFVEGVAEVSKEVAEHLKAAGIVK